jgi:hypothetical protein
VRGTERGEDAGGATLPGLVTGSARLGFMQFYGSPMDPDERGELAGHRGIKHLPLLRR